MLYQSTRNRNVNIESAQAIAHGISDEGGLFVPENLPALSNADFGALAELDYCGRATEILSAFLTDFTKEEVRACAQRAYGSRFDCVPPAPLRTLYDGVYMLELWHGPTSAFKDMALQILPHLLTKSAEKTAKDKKMIILVATSGDTGKAALEGFQDIDNTEILVFYPKNGVSMMQKLQMITQPGSNVHVCGIGGNFDDAQNGVKKIFTDPDVKKMLQERNMQFSSANSINWGRLVPQIVYYLSAYCDLFKSGEIRLGDKINIVVPTGNFGNILAAYYAKKMGMPLHKLICASNKNRVLTDFINTGVYDRNREFYTTISPSMDILISSNLERLLFDLCGKDDAKILDWMQNLAEHGRYEVDKKTFGALRESFYGGYCDEEQTQKTIRETYQNHHYLCDTHTAVGIDIYEQYRRQTADKTPTILASTASPYKFPQKVLESVFPEKVQGDEFNMAEILQRETGVSRPPALAELTHAKPRHLDVCAPDEMREFVLSALGLS